MARELVPDRERIAYAVVDFWACGWYRCFVPGLSLKRAGYEVSFHDGVATVEMASIDVVVVQNPAGPQRHNAILAANKMGKLTVAELDDDVWNIPPTNHRHDLWTRSEVIGSLEASLREVQLVTVPTDVLADIIRPLNPNVRVLPNMLPPEDWDYPTPKAQRDGPLVLGWAGSRSHVGDLELVADVIGRLLDRYPALEVAIAGGPEQPELPDHPRVRTLEETDIQGYPGLLERFDIGMIPLADTAFNRAKSDLKFLEYSALGIPSVASRTAPYIGSIEHGENGFLASTPSDWVECLSRLIEDAELRRRIGASAHSWAQTRRIDTVIDRWVKAYGLGRP